MDKILIIYPVLPVVLMNFIVMFHMRYMIVKAIKNRDTKNKYFRAYEGSAPEYLLTARIIIKTFLKYPFYFFYYVLCFISLMMLVPSIYGLPGYSLSSKVSTVI
ncbi:MAG: hypothetical protein Ct9H300mP29_3070 [Candidatus Neomarinimicrobiota bacterium]|nr:MAG: hypothetical protein Ct9H300mP29_3070 [Candidatus Neomarinimicrobiota bacterium]